MKKVLLLCTFLVAVSLKVPEISAQTHPFFPDSLREAGMMCPIHLVKQDIRWYNVSTDLFTYLIDNGTYGFYGPQPKLFVDGIPVDINFFGWQDLNLLPIVQTQRGSFGLQTQVHNGILSPAGFINFNNPSLKRGINGYFSHYTGIETGDPGPYQFDSSKITPNVDRWGPDNEIALGYKINGWYAKALYNHRHYNPTDLPLNGRLHFTSSLLGTNIGYANHLLLTTTESGLIETGYKSMKWGVRGRVIYGGSRDYVFLQPFGREVPAKLNYHQYAFAGFFKFKHWTLNGIATAHQKYIHQRFKLTPNIFDWKQYGPTFSLSSAYHKRRVRIKSGLTYEHLFTDAPGLSHARNQLLTLFVNTTLPITKQVTLSADLTADYNGRHNVSKTMNFDLSWQVLNFWKVIPGFNHTEVLPIRQQSFSYWVGKGYTFADSLGIPYPSSFQVKKDKLNIYKLRNVFAISDNISLELGTELIHHLSLNIPFQQVKPNEFITDTNPGPFTLTQEKGTQIRLFAQFQHRIGDRFHQVFSVLYKHTVSGSKRYISYFKQQPETKIQYQIDVKPAPDLILSLTGLYRTSTKWNEFKAIEGNYYRLPAGIPVPYTGGPFHIRTPASANITVSIQKYFWKRHISAQVAVRNLLNDEIRMHPMGADLPTIFEVKVGINI